MLITKVEIRNIKSHAEAQFDFNAGVTAICGPNGAGKTTIIEAIAWTLFDYLEYNRDDFVRRGAKRGQAAVTFRSSLDDREYQVVRDTGGGYYVFDTDTKTRLLEQKKDVVAWLKQQIGLEPTSDLPTLFKTTIGVPQGTFTADFLLAPAPRKKIFDQILKVEEYRAASDNLRDTVKHLTNRIHETERTLAEAEGELKIYDEIYSQFVAIEIQLKNLTAEKDQLTARIQLITDQLNSFQTLLQKIQQQNGIVERTNIKLNLTRGNLSTARDAAEQAAQAAAIVAQAKAGFERYKQATQTLANLEQQRTERDTLRTQAAQFERELIALTSQYDSTSERLRESEAARQELAQLSSQVQQQQELETLRSALQKSHGELEGLRHSEATMNRELERLRMRFAANKEQILTARKHQAEAERADELDTQLRNLIDQLSQADFAQRNLKSKQEQFTQSTRELQRIQNEHTQLTQEIARLKPLAQQAQQLATLESKQAADLQQLAKLQAELARDTEMIVALEKGGLCPLLTEKCLNLKPGESIELRFKSGQALKRKEISNLEDQTLTQANDLKRLRIAEAEIARLPKLLQDERSVSASVQSQQALVKQLSGDLQTDAATSEAQIQQLRRDRIQLETELKQARDAQNKYAQIQIWEQQLIEIKAEGEQKKKEHAALTEKLNKLGDLAQQLAEIESQLKALGDPRTRAATLQQSIARTAEWQAQIQKNEAAQKTIHAQLAQVQTKLTAFAKLESELVTATAQRTATEQDYQAYIANEKVGSTANTRAAEVATLTEELAATESALNAATAVLVDLESQYKTAEHQAMLTEFQHTKDRLTQIATQLEHVAATHQQLQTRLTYLDEVRDRRNAALASQQKLSQLSATTDFIRETLQKAAPYITEAYLHSISLEANQLYREITGRYDVVLKWSNDYEVTLEEKGYSRPFANLSGGEQMSAALSIRLALLREFSDHLSLAFFDEPTTNMDEDRRRNLAQQIGRITGFRQLFVISHDDSFENFTDQVVMIGDRE